MDIRPEDFGTPVYRFKIMGRDATDDENYAIVAATVLGGFDAGVRMLIQLNQEESAKKAR